MLLKLLLLKLLLLKLMFLKLLLLPLLPLLLLSLLQIRGLPRICRSTWKLVLVKRFNSEVAESARATAEENTLEQDKFTAMHC